MFEESFSYLPEIISPEINLWRKLPHASGLEKVKLLQRLSDYSFERGRIGTACLLLESAIAIVEEMPLTGRHEFLGRLYLNLGSLKICHRLYSDAISHLTICLELFRLVDSGYIATALRSLGDAHAKNGDQQSALYVYELVIGSLNPETDLYDFRRDSHSKGLTLMRMYNWDGALLPLLDARKAAESCDDLDSVFDEDIEISHCLFQLRDAELALTFANCAMEYALSVESSDRLFWALTRRGNALYLMGKLDEAEDLFTKALGNLHKDYEFVWELILLAERNLAKTLLFKGQTVAADESFRRLNTVAEIIGSDPLNSEVFLRKTAGNKME